MDVHPMEFRLDIEPYDLTALYWPGYPAITWGHPDNWEPECPGEFELIGGTVWDDEREEFRALSQDELDKITDERSREILTLVDAMYESERYSDRERDENDAKSAWEGR